MAVLVSILGGGGTSHTLFALVPVLIPYELGFLACEFRIQQGHRVLIQLLVWSQPLSLPGASLHSLCCLNSI